MTDLFFLLIRMSIPTSMLILVILALRLILAKAPKRWRLVLWGDGRPAADGSRFCRQPFERGAVC